MGPREHPPDERHAPPPSITPKDVDVDSLLVVRILLIGWLIAGLVVWTVPSITHGHPEWWRLVPVAGLVLGAIGHTYLNRRAPPGRDR